MRHSMGGFYSKIKKVLLYITGLVIALLLTFVGVNLFDRKPIPEVEALLADRYKVAEEQKPYFYFLLGLYDGASQEEAEAHGRVVWKRIASGQQIGFKKKIATLFPMSAEHEKRLTQMNTSPSSRDLRESPELRKILKENDVNRQIIHKIFSYGRATNLFSSSGKFWMSGGISSIALEQHKASNLIFLDLAERINKGDAKGALEQIKNSNYMAQDFLKTGTIFEALVGLLRIQWNAQFFKHEIEIDSHLKISDDIIDSFSLPDIAWVERALLRTEMNIVRESLQFFESPSDLFAIFNLGPSEEEAIAKNTIDLIPFELFFKRQDTLNYLYNIYQQTWFAKDKEKCFQRRKRAISFYNPGGRAVAEMFGSGLCGRKDKMLAQYKKIEELQDSLRQRQIEMTNPTRATDK